VHPECSQFIAASFLQHMVTLTGFVRHWVEAPVRTLAQCHLRRAGPGGRAAGTRWLVIDRTGVGSPETELLRRAAGGIPSSVVEAVSVHGERLKGNPAPRDITVDKLYLVARLQVLPQRRRVHLPKTAGARPGQRAA
jgi:hypothetical protein